MGEGKIWACVALSTGNSENTNAHKVWLGLKMVLPLSIAPELPCARHWCHGLEEQEKPCTSPPRIHRH